MDISITNSEELIKIEVGKLEFDRKNPRLLEFELPESAPESEVIDLLWDTMNIEELIMSIVANGFFQHEPVFFIAENNKNFVIEGNRRLAALKIILDDKLMKKYCPRFPNISEIEKQSLSEIPAILVTRESAWRYLGFKHVNGPTKWRSYAKSKYIADVHRDFNISLADIARQIGDNQGTVQRLYRGFMVIEQAERMKVFNRKDRYKDHFSFSHLYVGIDYAEISNFLNLRPKEDESKEPVPENKINELGELCLWLFGNTNDGKPPVVASQNPHLRQLVAVVGNFEALSELRRTNNLANAYELTHPSSIVFEESLIEAKQNLKKARGVISIGYSGSSKLFKIAGEVKKLSEDLYKEMNNFKI